MRRRVPQGRKGFIEPRKGEVNAIPRSALESARCFILPPERGLEGVRTSAYVLAPTTMVEAIRSALRVHSARCTASIPLWDGKVSAVPPSVVNARYAAIVKKNRADGMPADKARDLARASVSEELSRIAEANRDRGFAVSAFYLTSCAALTPQEVMSLGALDVVMSSQLAGSSESQSHINPNLPRPVGLKRTGFHDEEAIKADRKANPFDKVRKAPAPSADNSAAAKALVDRMKDPNLSPSGLLWPDRVTGLPIAPEEQGFRHADGHLSPLGEASPLIAGTPHALINLVLFMTDNGLALDAYRAECAAWTIDI